MPTQSRRDRAREERRELIVRTARMLAESDGWDHVTTRRLAEQVDYSQPVLYSHFKNMQAIATAVALEGFAELAEALSNALESDGLRGLARAYLAYAEEHPAVYEAMFIRSTDLVFGGADSPPALLDAFNAIRSSVTPYADDSETLTEVFWSALHGLASLGNSARLRPDAKLARVDLLLATLTKGA
ncbi:TetR/AcrR family transcriptional regulator [Kribbella sp. NPDC026611]|uniref:TetR/AcrR family transcriptional regulator n=1 Tax=Kribbella sp. NPDC026611 TaxID=3154911 RepID=UPI0033D2099D